MDRRWHRCAVGLRQSAWNVPRADVAWGKSQENEVNVDPAP